ncbi:hypothetical protein PG994_000852 [Apiospora phragmitis]|uniref:Uncharacterized protein n=1 Tax=Apiospora phragmitis TaxID=2905665 RepID=A0ABR1X7I5_9PEZI
MTPKFHQKPLGPGRAEPGRFKRRCSASDPDHIVKDWRYFGLEDINFEWPDMRRWCELAEEYFSRRLTYDYDAFSALAGTISVFNRTSPGGFVWGLPDYFFDIFLLWDIEWTEEIQWPSGSDAPQRRVQSAGIPSWSFLGWKGGNLNTLCWRFSMDHLYREDLVRGFGHNIIL